MKRYISSALWAAFLCLCLAFTGGTVYAQTVEELKDKVNKLQAVNTELRREIDTRKSKNEELTKQIDELIKAKGALEKKVETLETENRNLKNTLSAKQGDAATQVDELNNEKADLQKQLDAVNKEIEKLEKENAALQEQNKANQMPPFATIVLVGALIVCLVLLFLQVGRVKQLQKRLAVAPTGTPRDAAHKNLDTELRVIIQQIEASEKRVLEALLQSENMSQIALTNFANNLRQQIRAEEPRPTKTPNKEESQPDPTQQTLYQYNLYAEAVSAKGVFSQVNTAKGKEKMFVLELQNADDRKALYDLNRESPNYATWLSDRGQYLEHSCAIEGGAPLAPKHCTTIEKGVAVLEGGEWHVVKSLSLRLS